MLVVSTVIKLSRKRNDDTHTRDKELPMIILALSTWFVNKLNGKSGVVDVIVLVPKMIFLRVTNPVVVSVYNAIVSVADCP